MSTMNAKRYCSPMCQSAWRGAASDSPAADKVAHRKLTKAQLTEIRKRADANHAAKMADLRAGKYDGRCVCCGDAI